MSPTLHVSPVQKTPDALELRLWRENPNEHQPRILPLAEIADLLRLAETDYYSPLPARLAEVGQRLYRWLDDGDRWLTREIQAAGHGAPVLVLAIAMPHGLAHLPWEVLHDNTDFLFQLPNPPVLPVRWLPARNGAHPVANRPLQALFMASSPEHVQPPLDYEGEEAAILGATARHPLDLTVEESGCLAELSDLVRDHTEHFFDVLHLTGHATHSDDGSPIFLLEDSVGQRKDATAPDIARALPHRMPLVFLSGCRTGQNPAHGEVRSLAEQLLAAGFRAVLGWGRPVRDAEAIIAASALYQRLAAGDSLPFALVTAQQLLSEKGARDWHLLRLFCAGEVPGAFVTPRLTLDRKAHVHGPAEAEFLDPLTRTVKVATRASFVGRRRLLQQSLRRLRDVGGQHVGLLLRGQGGRGKSSVAARLCDRLRREFQRVVVIGLLDEVSFTNAWAAALQECIAQVDKAKIPEARRPEAVQAHSTALRDPGVELATRIEALLLTLRDFAVLPPLFVLDDFEQNQPGEKQGDLALAPAAAAVLPALFAALARTGFGRVLITCRYALPAPFDRALAGEDVPPLDRNERMKQMLRLDQKTARHTRDPALLMQAVAAADGNPRLFEWLHRVLEQPGLDHAGIVAQMHAAEEKFREAILAQHLVASLPEDARVLLGQMLRLTVPVPYEAVAALDPTRPPAALRQTLDRAAALSLVDITTEDDAPHYRVPQQLAGGDPPLLPTPAPAAQAAEAARVFEVLHRVWVKEAKGTSEPRALELIALAAAGGRKEELVELADVVTSSWLKDNRSTETAALLEPLLDAAGRPAILLTNLARARQTLGHGEASGALLKEAVTAGTSAPEHVRAVALFHYTRWLSTQGDLDEVLRISRDELHPLFKAMGQERECAVVLGEIADVLTARGELAEALRIRREEELPVYVRLGDVRGRAVTLGKVADVLAARGELEEAVRCYTDEVLPALDRLGDLKMRAVCLSQIADVLEARGELEEALRIRREEELPVFERLGDVRERAMTLGRIADVLEARGELEEALRIRREELLPVYERLGDVRSRAVTLRKIADIAIARGNPDDGISLLNQAIELIKPLGAVRDMAVFRGIIADVLTARGELEEALHIRRTEQLPVFERLGDVQGMVAGRTNMAILLLLRQRQKDIPEALGLLRWSYQAARQRGYKEAAQIAGILQQLGVPVPE